MNVRAILDSWGVYGDGVVVDLEGFMAETRANASAEMRERAAMEVATRTRNIRVIVDEMPVNEKIELAAQGRIEVLNLAAKAIRSLPVEEPA